jgi:hypothetical protein
MSVITNGVRVTGSITPTDTTDVYATHDSTYGLGGHREVVNTLARDNISMERRRIGMTVYVQDVDKFFYLKDGITNSDWKESVLIDSAIYDKLRRKTMPFIIGEVMSTGSQNIIIQVPFDAYIETISAFAIEAGDADTVFDVVKMSSADYYAGSTNWTSIIHPSSPITFRNGYRIADAFIIADRYINETDYLMVTASQFSRMLKGINIEVLLLAN